MRRALRALTQREELAFPLPLPTVGDHLALTTEPSAAHRPSGLRSGDRPGTVRRTLLEAARPRRAEETSGLDAHEPHALVHQLERRLTCAARFLGADCEQSLQLALVGAQGVEPFADRREELDHRLADRLFEVAVAGAGEALLEHLDRLVGRHAHDLEQVRDARLRCRVVANLT